MRAAVAFTLVALLASGCLDTAHQDDGTGAEPGQGAVDGVVVSLAIAPLAGVNVTLEPGGQGMTTAEDGRFWFTNLAAGAYTLRAVRAGFRTAQVGIQVQEGPTAPVVKVVLEPDGESAAFVETYAFDGFIEWSFNAAGTRSVNSASPNYTIGLRPPDFIQSELVWESTQSFGQTLDMTAMANDGNLTIPEVGHAVGTSPLLLTINSTAIQDARLGPAVLLDYAVFAGEEPVAADTGGGLVLSQSYRLVTHMFYGYLPPEGWRFTVDGEAPPPT